MREGEYLIIIAISPWAFPVVYTRYLRTLDVASGSEMGSLASRTSIFSAFRKVLVRSALGQFLGIPGSAI